MFEQIPLDFAPFRKTNITLEMVEQAYCACRLGGFRFQVCPVTLPEPVHGTMLPAMPVHWLYIALLTSGRCSIAHPMTSQQPDDEPGCHLTIACNAQTTLVKPYVK